MGRAINDIIVNEVLLMCGGVIDLWLNTESEIYKITAGVGKLPGRIA
ncbi:hypothetical protein D083_1026 [Dickeya solani RNS 08.23.3.1.A]|nr:hypothetical protein D083_1026 [Dickeya solani RNS 08.23.3.1.A]